MKNYRSIIVLCVSIYIIRQVDQAQLVLIIKTNLNTTKLNQNTRQPGLKHEDQRWIRIRNWPKVNGQLSDESKYIFQKREKVTFSIKTKMTHQEKEVWNDISYSVTTA